MAQFVDEKAKVLIISDEPAAADIWGFSLRQIGLEVLLIDVSNDYLAVFEKVYPDMIILEDFNDQIEELEICRQLRTVTVVPIIYLTSKTNERFQLDVYEAGADECVPYPLTPRLFQSKVRAWLRRTKSIPFSALDEIRVESFVLDPNQKQITLSGGDPVKLTSLETRLLVLMMNQPGKVIQTEDIIERVWGHYDSIDHRLLKNHIYRLRRKIEPDPSHPRLLLNIGNAGYKFAPQTGASGPEISE